MSCRTNASRSAGASVSSTTSSASPTLGQQRLLFGVDPALAADDRLGQVHPAVPRAARARAGPGTRASSVVSQPPGCGPRWCRWPAAEPQPGSGRRSSASVNEPRHPVTTALQVGAVGLNRSANQSRSSTVTFLVAFRHHSVEPNPAEVTRRMWGARDDAREQRRVRSRERTSCSGHPRPQQGYEGLPAEAAAQHVAGSAKPTCPARGAARTPSLTHRGVRLAAYAASGRRWWPSRRRGDRPARRRVRADPGSLGQP